MPTRRKLIGLTGPSSFSQDCIDCIEEFIDANFVLLYHGTDANLNHWLNEVDGILISGGIDIHPTVYSESVWTNHNLTKFDIKRDCRELQIIDYCLAKGKPLLGVCRGHQLLGIRHGLGFLMDLSDSFICHQPQRQNIVVTPKDPLHSVKIISPDTLFGTWKMPQGVSERKVLRDVLHERKSDKVWVNSFHHQGVVYNPKFDYPTCGVEVIGTATVDLKCCKDIVEIMQGPKWIGVQFHPEFDWRENTVSRVVLQRFKDMLA